MKKHRLVVLSLSLFVGVATCAVALADQRADAAGRGAKLFADTSLGANGKSCSSCHGDGSVWAGKARFPKVAVGGMHTLDQTIQTCIANALGARPLAWDDPRITALAVFVDAAYAPKK